VQVGYRLEDAGSRTKIVLLKSRRVEQRLIGRRDRHRLRLSTGCKADLLRDTISVADRYRLSHAVVGGESDQGGSRRRSGSSQADSVRQAIGQIRVRFNAAVGVSPAFQLTGRSISLLESPGESIKR
jgi:hypothetical protein